MTADNNRTGFTDKMRIKYRLVRYRAALVVIYKLCNLPQITIVFTPLNKIVDY